MSRKLTPLEASSLVASWIDCDREACESDFQRDLYRLHDHLLMYLHPAAPPSGRVPEVPDER